MPLTMTKLPIFVTALTVWFSATPSFACGMQTDCDVTNGDYRVFLPESWDETAQPASPRGAILFFHGWKGSSTSTINNKHLRDAATEMGVALVATNGIGGGWSIQASPQEGRDELAYTQAVLDDITQRFGIDPDRVMASGFSLGASVVWNLSCFMGDRFAGFAPIAGTFWNPLPEACPSANPHLFHYHGKADGTFPLTGRAIAGGLYRQGNTYEAFEIWKTQGTCQAEKPTITTSDGLTCERRSQCAGGTLENCLHEGGHIYDANWIKRSWARLTEINGWQR